MKRATITMDEYGRVAVPSDAASVWMSEMELVKFFDVIAPTLRAAIRAVYKSGGLNPCEVERRIKLPNGYFLEVYALPMVVALANGRCTCLPYQHTQCRKGAQCPFGKDVLAKRQTNSVAFVKRQTAM